jgi:apolipoprotein N-acyltransferase
MMISNKIFCNIFALIFGALLTLSFAPFHLYILAFISPALLLLMWQSTEPKQAFWYGWFYGIGFFGTGVYWVYISVHVYGHAPLLLAFSITALLIMFLALFFAIQGYLWNKYCKVNLLFFPISWVLFEWLRSWVLTGFPWLFLGYSQLSTPLSGIAPIFGVYGVSFAVALTAVAIAIMVKSIIKQQFFLLKHYLLLITFAIWLISIFLMHQHWTYPVGAPIKVSLIQGNIPQEAKWAPSQSALILAKYKKLTGEHWDSRLIVWPEAAIPMFDWQAKDFIDHMSTEAKKHKTTIITGVPIGIDDKYYNGIITLGKNKSVYLKRHLVPFGEYPFLGVITKILMTVLKIPMSEFTPGPRHQPVFIASDLIIAPMICYEIAYPNEVLDFFPQAELLLNISDDSWFGESIAADQQLEIAQMRSLETGRYQLVAGNTGITAIINPDGTIQNQLPPFKEMVLTGSIQAMKGLTPWVLIAKKLL